VPASPAPSGRPSAWLRQHHAVEAPRVDDLVFHPAWRVRTRLDTLAPVLTRYEFQVATTYRLIAERAAAGDLHAVEIDGEGRRANHYRGSRLERSERLLDGLRHLAAVRESLGAGPLDLVEAVVIDDLSWRQIGRRLRVDHKTARSRVLAPIKALAAAWTS
jgi:hypothetical protein